MSKTSPPIVLITGAGSGIGAATARRFARDGARLLLANRGADAAARTRLGDVAAICRSLGADVATATADLAEGGAAASLVQAALDAFGGLDVLVSNAGFAERGLASGVDRVALHRSFDLVTVVFSELLAAAKAPLIASARGSVIAVSSFVAHEFRGDALFAPSAAAKAALEALVRTAAAELAGEGITVNAVVPGYTRKDPGRHSALSPQAWQAITARIPLARLADPDDIAGAIAFLAGDEARYITGQRLAIDGGLSL